MKIKTAPVYVAEDAWSGEESREFDTAAECLDYETFCRLKKVADSYMFTVGEEFVENVGVARLIMSKWAEIQNTMLQYEKDVQQYCGEANEKEV
jgi:hypothetical protein